MHFTRFKRKDKISYKNNFALLALPITSQELSCTLNINHISINFAQISPREFEWLYDQYSGAIYGVVRRIINDEELAREALQDVFFKIWKNKDKYDHTVAKLYTWMSRIARNHSLNIVNSKSEKNQRKNQSLDASVYSLGGHYNRNEECVDIQEIVSQIDPKYKRVIEYAYFKGYTQKEISEELEMPLGSVKTAIKIGLRKLKAIYDYGKKESHIISIMLFNVFVN